MCPKKPKIETQDVTATPAAPAVNPPTESVANVDTKKGLSNTKAKGKRKLTIGASGTGVNV